MEKYVFIDGSGKFYKATKAKNPNDARKVLVSEDFLKALPDNGSSMELIDIDSKIKAAQDARA